MTAPLRPLRHAVILRKISLGTQSQRSNRWIEGICSVRETCRLQHRPIISYLIDVATAAQQRRPIPTLVPTGPTRADRAPSRHRHQKESASVTPTPPEHLRRRDGASFANGIGSHRGLGRRHGYSRAGAGGLAGTSK